MEFAKKGAVIGNSFVLCFKKIITIILGFDGRHNSALYASIVASVFLSQDIKVLMFKEMVATPLVVCQTNIRHPSSLISNDVHWMSSPLVSPNFMQELA